VRLTFALAACFCLAAFSGIPIVAGDLSRYREFHLGAELSTVAGLAHMETSEAKVIQRRPALIQELEWEPRLLGASAQVDPVKNIVFGFYNGELYRIVINYDRYKTDGMTAGDLTEALSATYGTATRPEATVSIGSLVYAESEKVIARWEDSEYSFSLLRSSYQPSFGVVAVSKRLEGLARTALIEAARLDKQEAPQREAESLRMHATEERAQQEKARLTNRPNFRP
jgi:hypothetical protein